MALFLSIVHGLLAATAVVTSVLGVQARTGERARRMATGLLAAVGGQTVAGDVLYPIYLRTAKPTLRTFSAGSRSVADVFDVKEHLAFFALVLAIAAFVLTRREPKPTPFLRVLFGGAHGAIVLVAALGLVVWSIKAP